MIPPGIYVWDASGKSDDLEALRRQIAIRHPRWADELTAKSPWNHFNCFQQIGPLSRAEYFTEATVIICDSVETTMSGVLQFAQYGALSSWGSLVAVQQSQGRGQLRRPWFSPPGNLCASIVLPGASELGSWTKDRLDAIRPILFGHVICQVLQEIGADIELKWPNDILQNGRKVGGMLIEERGELVILGLGLNLAESPPDEVMREDHSVPAAVLQIPESYRSPLTLLETLVNRGKNVYTHMLDELEPSQFVSVAAHRLAWYGQTVLVRENGQPPYRARVVGLSLQGGLILDAEGGERTLYSGSIFLCSIVRP